MSVLKDSYTTSTSYSNCYGTRWLAQTFTAGSSYTISEVSIKAFRGGALGEKLPGTVTISIRATSGGSPTGADLCSGTIDGDGFTTSSTGLWYTVDLGAGTALSSGTVYAIVCRATSGDSDNWMGWRLDGDAGYDSGRGLTSTNSGSSWNGQSYDFTFRTYKDVVNYNVNISCGLGLSPSVSASRGKTVSSSTSLSLSPSVTAVRGRNESCSTNLSLNPIVTRTANYSRDVLTDLTITSLVTRTVNYAVRHIVTNLSMTPIVTRAVGYTRTISTSLSLTSIVSAIKRGWVKVKLKLFKRSVNMYMNNRNVKVKLHKRDVNLKIRRK